LIYSYNENWIGGTYYVQNLISALANLPGPQQPEISIFYKEESDFQRLTEAVQYPNLKKRPLNTGYEKRLPVRVVNRISRKLLQRNILKWRLRGVDVLFPVFFYNQFHTRVKNLFWIPDFQERFFPAFFGQAELDARIANQESIAGHGEYVVFSSNDARKAFESFFPDSKIRKYVLPFAVSHGPVKSIDPDRLRAKYGLNGEYFFAPNQLWQHKNQTIVLKAVAELKAQGKEIKVFFSGKEHDHRNPQYFGQLKDMVNDLGLEDNVRFLGFIDRDDQLALMSNALAIIQPSRFEGWSTVIEDAKALKKCIIASSLEVHKEQLGDKGHFFNPDDVGGLSLHLRNIQRDGHQIVDYDYAAGRQQFATSFMAIIEDILDPQKKGK